jgi:hypothetical protein
MSTPQRVAAFVTVLAVAFGAGWGGGRLVGPIDDQPAPTEHGPGMPGMPGMEDDRG